MRNWLKRIGIAILVPSVLILLIGLLLYLPPVQNWAVREAALYASEKTGMEITVSSVRLSFPIDLCVKGVKVLRPTNSLPLCKDTIADVQYTTVSIQFIPLLYGKVEIDKLAINHLKINTMYFLKNVHVRGSFGRLVLESHGIDLKRDTLLFNKVELADADIDVALSDTAKTDTTQNETDWQIAVGNLDVNRSCVRISFPGDTLRIKACLNKGRAVDGCFDLGRGYYQLRSFDLQDSRLKYDNRFESKVKGIDFNHLDINSLNIGIDSFNYCKDNLSLRIRMLSLKEKSGIEVSKLYGPVIMSNNILTLKNMRLHTPTSQILTNLKVGLDAFDDKQLGQMNIELHAAIGKQDLMYFFADTPQAFRQKWPLHPLVVDGVVRGNMKRLSFDRLYVKLPTAFTVHASGYVGNFDQPKQLSGDVDLQFHSGNLAFVNSLFNRDQQRQVNIPRNLDFRGNIKATAGRYDSRFMANVGKGKLKGQVSFDTRHTSYHANIAAWELPLHQIFHQQSLGPFSGVFYANGQGIDFLSSQTSLHAKIYVNRFYYGAYDLSGLTADATAANSKLNVGINVKNASADGQLALRGLGLGKRMCATVTADLRQLDLYRLKITSEPFTLALCGHLDICSNLKDSHEVKGLVSEIKAFNRGQTYHMEDMAVELLTRSDTTHAVADCGDFHLDMAARGSYQALMNAGENMVEELQKQLKNRYIDQALLRSHLPLARVELSSGKHNLLTRMLNYYGYQLKSFSCDMTSSPREGLNGHAYIDSLIVSGMQIDTINLAVTSDSLHTNYLCQVRNGPRNPQYMFNALLDGSVYATGTHLTVTLYDGNDKLGVGIGLAATMREDGIRISSYGQDPVLGYKIFRVNKDNYIHLSNDRRVSADVQLLADDGTGVQLFSDSTNVEVLQDITLSLHQFDLEKILSVLPYAPAVTGILSGDYHLIQTPAELTVSSNMSIEKMTYEACPMGNLSTEFVYMPKTDGSHYVDGLLMCDDEEIASVKGSYHQSGENNLLDATLHMNHLPLSMLNGFITEQIIGLGGYGDGELSVKGTLAKPVISGEVFLDSAYVFSEPYGVELHFDNDPVTITDSRFLFENFQMYAHNSSPLVMSGYFDFSDLAAMSMDVRMRAQNYLLIDSKENPRSETYGKAYVNFFGMVSGPVDELKMRGRLDLLGSTDMTYVLRDSPLTTDNQMDELVKFVNFNDTTADVVTRPPLTGLDVDLTLAVDENAHIMCALNADHSNYIDLEGGGNLRLQYNSVDNLRLTGRYTLSNGQMKYSLPVIPLKTFTIQDGSYIEFAGDPMNPKLNITATEQTKSSVSSEGTSGRTVLFESGVAITKTLKDMGLQFVIDAPEDMSVHNELQTLSAEERGKLAVTMLTTGMYLADGNTRGFSMNSALSAFLNSQINAISGNALRTLDVSFGMDNSTTASGGLHTDYSFKFAKRFWNNRLRIVVGGKVSSGAEIENQNNSFFDNVTFEYRLNQNASQYLRMFYQRDSYDWLDGNVSQFGAGFMWKRKLMHFKDIFRFKHDRDRLPSLSAPKDSVKTTISKNEKE